MLSVGIDTCVCICVVAKQEWIVEACIGTYDVNAAVVALCGDVLEIPCVLRVGVVV